MPKTPSALSRHLKVKEAVFLSRWEDWKQKCARSPAPTGRMWLTKRHEDIMGEVQCHNHCKALHDDILGPREKPCGRVLRTRRPHLTRGTEPCARSRKAASPCTKQPLSLIFHLRPAVHMDSHNYKGRRTRGAIWKRERKNKNDLLFIESTAA